MLAYIWPIGLVIASNVLYQICTKSVPGTMNPFASLTVSYAIGAIISLILYYAIQEHPDIFREYRHMNWAPAALGVVIVGLEVGYIYAYKAGWPVSTAAIVQSSFLSIALLAVGAMLYHEAVTWNKILGVIICMVGLGFLNYAP